MINIIKFFWHIVKQILCLTRKIYSKIIKKKISDDVWDNFIQFVMFALVGFSNTFISYITYCILMILGTNKYVASIAGFLVSMLNAFYWNNNYVFKKSEDEGRSVIKSFIKLFLSYAGTGLVLQNILLWLLTDKFSINSYIALILILFISTPLNFILNKFWSFAKNGNEK